MEGAANHQPEVSAGPVRRLRRAERREQILAAATSAFARAGFTATSLDDVAAEAGITRVILYRHFESKADMYRAVLDRACTRLAETVGTGNYGEDAIATLVRAAAVDPDAFRLLFRHAAREPEFREQADALTTASAEVARRDLAARIPEGPWLDWAARLPPAPRGGHPPRSPPRALIPCRRHPDFAVTALAGRKTA